VGGGLFLRGGLYQARATSKRIVAGEVVFPGEREGAKRGSIQEK